MNQGHELESEPGGWMSGNAMGNASERDSSSTATPGVPWAVSLPGSLVSRATYFIKRTGKVADTEPHGRNQPVCTQYGGQAEAQPTPIRLKAGQRYASFHCLAQRTVDEVFGCDPGVHLAELVSQALDYGSHGFPEDIVAVISQHLWRARLMGYNQPFTKLQCLLELLLGTRVVVVGECRITCEFRVTQVEVSGAV